MAMCPCQIVDLVESFRAHRLHAHASARSHVSVRAHDLEAITNQHIIWWFQPKRNITYVGYRCKRKQQKYVGFSRIPTTQYADRQKPTNVWKYMISNINNNIPIVCWHFVVDVGNIIFPYFCWFSSNNILDCWYTV